MFLVFQNNSLAKLTKLENFKKIIKELEGEGVFKIIKEEGNKFLIEYDNAKGAEFIKKAWENEGKLRGNEIEFFRSYHVITENKKWVHVGHYNDGLFPRIDFVDITDPKNPIGISYKTMDLSAESYAKKNVIENTINTQQQFIFLIYLCYYLY